MSAPLPCPPVWADARAVASLFSLDTRTLRAEGLLPPSEIVNGREHWRVEAIDEAMVGLWERVNGPRPSTAPQEPADRFMVRIDQVIRQKPTTNVYFASSHNWIKVGRAVNVDERLREMRSGNPHPIELIVDFPGTPALETAIHHTLRHLRHRGEWFNRDTDIERVIEYLREFNE